MEFRHPADEDRSARVQAALAHDCAVRAADEIAVLVREGVVTLRGTVPDRDERAAAAAAAARAAGRGAVVNLLEVDDGPRGDAELRAAALQALMYDTTLPSERIDVEVNGGRVTLSGRVRHRHQRDRAALGLAGLAGVRHIDNRITLRRQ
jgi:osmotically-inducible protein OsmY